MDRVLFLGMNGARQAQHAQSTSANNLANVSTNGFKADLAQFRSMPVYGAGQPSRVYAMAERPGFEWSQGRIEQTGRALDVAIQGEGFIAVQSETGEEAYTRAGSLQVGSDGLLTDRSGRIVLGDGGPITIPQAQSIEIGGDGTVSVQPIGEGPAVLAEVGRIRLVNPDREALRKGEDGLFRLEGGEAAPADAEVRMISGALESSNVNAVEEMVNLIDQSRTFEMQVKLMNEAKENDAATDRLMRMA